MKLRFEGRIFPVRRSLGDLFLLGDMFYVVGLGLYVPVHILSSLLFISVPFLDLW